MRAIILVLALAVTLAASAGADHCFGTVSEPEVQTGATPAGEHYVDLDICQLECVVSVWVYEESNGIAGLQRGDMVVDDTCHGIVPADTIVQAVVA